MTPRQPRRPRAIPTLQQAARVIGRRTPRKALAALAAAAALAGAGCGAQSDGPDPPPTSPSHATEQVVERAPDGAEIADSNAIAPGTKLTERPPSPSAARPARARLQETQANFISPGAPSDAEVAAELKQMQAVQQRASPSPSRGVRLQADGTVRVGSNVPDTVARVVAGANQIAKYPYVYGGGHGSFVDTAYDCSGSLSYALAAAGLLTSTKVSGEFARTGAPGPGKWITIYANAGHAFMVVGGVRFDTSGRDGALGSRWQPDARSTAGFAVRHPPGL